MDQFMNQKFNVNLVKAVEMHPIIYNTSIRGFNRKRCVRAREEAWKTIAEELKCEVPVIKKKWVIFRNALNRKPSEKVNIEHYYLYDHMKYLLPYLKRRKNKADKEQEVEQYADDQNMNDEDLSSEDYEIVDETDDIDQDTMSFRNCDSSLGEEIITDEPAEKICNSLPSPKRKSKPVNNNTSFMRNTHSIPALSDTQVASTSIRNAERVEFASGDDAKTHFLFSLLPDLDEMSNSQMRHFKSKVLQLIDEILTEN